METNRSTLRLLTVILIGCVLLPIALFASVAWTMWRDEQRNADERLGRALDVLNEHTSKVFNTAELIIFQVAALTENRTDAEIAEDAPRLHSLLSQMTAKVGERESVWISDKDGRPLVTDFMYPTPDVSISARDYFQVQKESNVGTYVGALALPRLPGAGPYFTLSRRRPPETTFNGIINVALQPTEFLRFYSDLGDLGHYFAVIREDGAFLARFPASNEPMPQAAGIAPAAALQLNKEHGIYTATSSLDGVKRRVGYLKLKDYPVYLLAGIEVASIRAEWLSRAGSHLVFGAPATVLLIIALLFAMSRTRRLVEEERRRIVVEEGLRRMQGLDALAQLTGGVAHDFNNLLMIISGSVARLRRTMQSDREVRSLDLIETAAERGERLTRQLLTFARRQRLVPAPVDLGRRIPDLREMLQRSLRGDIQLVLEMPDRSCSAMIDLEEFELALVNLAVNARDAMPQGGQLIISAKKIELSGEPDGLVGTYVALIVADTGTGIPPDVLSRVFDPFFTTKEVGKGTGLGLSQVYGFARQSGGAATIQSAPASGTAVTLYLPCTELPPAEPDASGQELSDAASGRHILVVEDNVDVADVTRSNLEALGYAVSVVARAEHAVRLLETSSPDAVLSDIVMPGSMNGLDLAREVRRLRSDLPVILATGYSASAQEAAKEGFVVLSKPYSLAQLDAALFAALQRPKSTAGIPT